MNEATKAPKSLPKLEPPNRTDDITSPMFPSKEDAKKTTAKTAKESLS